MLFRPCWCSFVPADVVKPPAAGMSDHQTEILWFFFIIIILQWKALDQEFYKDITTYIYGLWKECDFVFITNSGWIWRQIVCIIIGITSSAICHYGHYIICHIECNILNLFFSSHIWDMVTLYCVLFIWKWLGSWYWSTRKWFWK